MTQAAQKKCGAEIDDLIAEVARRHGILLTPDDPALVLVTLNELVLKAAMDQAAGGIRGALADFESAVAKLQAKAGSALGAQLKDAVAEARHEIAASARAARIERWAKAKQVAGWLIAGGLVFACGACIGHLVG